MRPENQFYLDEKPMIQQFMAERTGEKKDGHAYLCDLVAAYRGWRRLNHMGWSKLSVTSFGRAMPKKYARKLLNRGRTAIGKNPARAIMGLVLK